MTKPLVITVKLHVGDLDVSIQGSEHGVAMQFFDPTLTGDPGGVVVQLKLTRAEAYALAQAINRAL